MRTLNETEIMQISGGQIDTEGYNMSFLVSNTVTGGIIGTAIQTIYAVCFTDPFKFNPMPIGITAAIFSTYALAMMTAKIADAYFFSPEVATSITSPQLS